LKKEIDMKRLLLFIFITIQLYAIQPPLSEKGERRIVLVACSYNNEQWCEKNLSSMFAQNYDNYHVIYVDDVSTDNTYDRVCEYVDTHEVQDKISLIRNEQRMGAMANQYYVIQSCDPTDLIVIVDGDDFLAHKDVLAHLNNVYATQGVWLTYGQFSEYHGGAWSIERGTDGLRACNWCSPMPARVVQNNAFRSYAHIPSHLRTFYAGLFQNIKKEDLMMNGQFMEMCADIAAMFPMIEMARDHFTFIPNILLMYNAANSLNDHKVSKALQRRVDLTIRARPRYEKLENPFVVPLDSQQEEL